MGQTLTRDQVRRVDQLAVERHKIPSIILMENAGKNAAAIIDGVYGPDASAFILCGTGNNGGDGCVIARHLHNRGWGVRVLIAGDRLSFSDDMRVNYGILETLEVPITVASDLEAQRSNVKSIESDDVVVDAVLGTGFRGKLREDKVQLFEAVNGARKRATIAVDVPSGLDCDTGHTGGTAVRADQTITFVAAKPGFSLADGPKHVGRVDVVDIGAPRELVEQIAASRM